jgi:peptide/nickel transport system substrate-binding protein
LADSGRSYTFQVRSGIRYSNGKLVQPQNFKHELERLFEVGDPLTAAVDYSKIVGADRCTAGKPCNLDGGIVVDRSARTVTFHLTAPDPDFLAKLAQPSAFAVPGGDTCARRP